MVKWIIRKGLSCNNVMLLDCMWSPSHILLIWRHYSLHQQMVWEVCSIYNTLWILRLTQHLWTLWCKVSFIILIIWPCLDSICVKVVWHKLRSLYLSLSRGHLVFYLKTMVACFLGSLRECTNVIVLLPTSQFYWVGREVFKLHNWFQFLLPFTRWV